MDKKLKRCSKYLPDEYKLSGLWINKVTNETNVDDVFHNDAADLTIITYINEDFEGGEFEYFFKNQKIKIIPKINYSIISMKYFHMLVVKPVLIESYLKG